MDPMAPTAPTDPMPPTSTDPVDPVVFQAFISSRGWSMFDVIRMYDDNDAAAWETTMHAIACVNRAGRDAAQAVLAKRSPMFVCMRLEAALRRAISAGRDELLHMYLGDDAAWAVVCRHFDRGQDGALATSLLMLAAYRGRADAVRLCLLRVPPDTSVGMVIIAVDHDTVPDTVRQLCHMLQARASKIIFEVPCPPPPPPPPVPPRLLGRCLRGMRAKAQPDGHAALWMATLTTWLDWTVSTRDLVYR